RHTSCLFQGRYYPANSSFVTPDCTMQCYCMGNGATSCMDLCSPLPKGECPLGMKILDEKEPAGPRGSKCYCIRRYCAAAYCYTNKFEKYKIGESFQRGNCSELCTCTEEGQFDCRPLCPKKKCPRGFKRKAGKKQLIFGCPCQKQRCIPKKRRACKYNGKTYTTRRYFEANNCQSKCRCKRNGVIRCSPLCPDSKTPKCGPNESLVGKKTSPPQIAKGRCQCSKLVCVTNSDKRENECRVDGHTFTQGIEYVDRNCTKTCKCTNTGQADCQPLCPNNSTHCANGYTQYKKVRVLNASWCSCVVKGCIAYHGKIFTEIEWGGSRGEYRKERMHPGARVLSKAVLRTTVRYLQE
ncbi:hypothetical protein QZH41_013039, partial [Actinostola sp. cb2023]